MEDRSAWAASLPKPTADEREHILVYTVSDREQEGLITGLAIASYDTNGNDIRAVHIPTETLLEAEGFMPLSHVYDAGGRQLLTSSVANLLGVSIHSYLEIDEEMLPFAVDKVGVTTLPSGLSVNNGSDVLSVIHADGLRPFERLERRRQVMTAIGASILDAGYIGKLRTFLAVSPLVQTNMSWRKLLTVMDSFQNVKYQEAVMILDLPGKEEVQSGGAYWLADAAATTELSIWLSADSPALPRSQTTIEVLNGSGIPGIATSLAEKLKAEGYSVVTIGNADRYDYETSQVICHMETMDAAKDVAILVPHAELIKSELSQTDVHVTVIIGKNYSQE